MLSAKLPGAHTAHRASVCAATKELYFPRGQGVQLIVPVAAANVPDRHLVQFVVAPHLVEKVPFWQTMQGAAPCPGLVNPGAHGVQTPSSLVDPVKSGNPEVDDGLLKPRPGGQVALVIGVQSPVEAW